MSAASSKSVGTIFLHALYLVAAGWMIATAEEEKQKQ